MAGWVSPRLGVRFELSESELQIYRPDGQRFLTYLELARDREQAEARAQQAEARAQQAEAQLQTLQNLLRERGIDPEQL